MFFPIISSPRRQLAVIALFATACYVPFINKALHVDADMLVHTSAQFLADPLNPPLGEYGRHMVLHDHTKMPESSVFYRTGHPPLLPVLLASVIAASGTREWPLHAAMFPFYLLCVGAVWLLLGLFFNAEYRFFGTLLWAASPACLVNAHNIMWDVPVTGLILLSLVLYLLALRRGSASLMVFSGLAAGAAALTKVSCLPLFLLCPGNLLVRGRFRECALWLAPAAVPPLLWVVHNLVVFGKIHYLSVGWYSFWPGDIRYRMERDVSYLGGALFLPLFWLWVMLARRRIAEGLLCLMPGALWGALLVVSLHKPLWFGAAYALFAAAGVWLLYRMLLLFRRPGPGTWQPHEPALLAAFGILCFFVLNVMPSASMRYILPLVPLWLIVLGPEVAGLSSRHRSLFLWTALLVGTLFSLCLSTGDYLLCAADRTLPAALKAKGYVPSRTWYYGRLSYDWYLFHAGFRNLRADEGTPADGDRLVDEIIPGDYRAVEILGDKCRVTPEDTISLNHWPLRTLGFGAGFYGADRLPYAMKWGAPQKRYCVYRVERL